MPYFARQSVKTLTLNEPLLPSNKASGMDRFLLVYDPKTNPRFWNRVMRILKLVIIAAITLFTSTSAFAWTWTCSPLERNQIATIPPPKINLMLDKSGSMGPDPSYGGIFASSCKVCQLPNGGGQVRVDSYAECVDTTPGTVRKITLGRYSTGHYPTYDFYNVPVPPANNGLFPIEVSIQGDYGAGSEYAWVFVNGTYIGAVTNSIGDCGVPRTQTFYVSSALASGTMHVRVRGTYKVQTFCTNGRNNTTIRTGGIGGSYLGTLTNDTVCGVTKWEIAQNAIDGLTQFSDTSNPELAHFGLGLFSGGSATNLVACQAQNHDNIMNVLDSNGPGGGTPTGTAIRQSVAGNCFLNAATQPTATVLINDGAPNNRLDAINAACTHRNTALLYVVGLGSGTDEDYNNILAVAGGTGTCDNDADPCTNPNGWANLRNHCQGSIQTSNQSELTTAIGNISANLACTFSINFSGTVLSSVPADGSSRYEYLYVDYTDAAGNPVVIYHEDSSLATDRNNDGVQDGWSFVDANRDFVKLGDYFCGQVQTGQIVETATQLACLCEESTGNDCNVPNYENRGVCPTGTWQCTEGVDFCEPASDCCVPGEACTVPGGVGVCAQGVTECPTDSGIDGNIPAGAISFQISSDNPTDRTKTHYLDSISVAGTPYTDILVPDAYESSFPNGTNMYTTLNNVVQATYNGNPSAWNANALQAFQSRNLGFYQGNDSMVQDNIDYYTLSYNEPVLVSEGRFVSFTERHSNNPVNIQALDSSGNPLGAVVNVLTSHYVPTGHRTNFGQIIGIATYPLDDLAPAGSRIAAIRIFPLSYGANDAADGKVFIFGHIPVDNAGSGAAGICVPAVVPSAEICDGLDNDCDGAIDEIDNTDCTVPGQKGRCAAGQLACQNDNGNFNTVCVQSRFPMPELCDGLDNDCDGQEDNISNSWEKSEFQSMKASMVNPLDRAKACDFEDVCICNNGAMDNHAGDSFMSYLAEWDPECQCQAALEEDMMEESAPIAEETGGEDQSNPSDTTVVGCSSTNGQGSLPYFLLLGFFFLGRRRKK